LPPVRTGVSLADSVAALYAVTGLLAALFERGHKPEATARVVDVALYESIFSLMEGALIEYGRLGVVRGPAGSGIPTAAPTNVYRCADGRWICIAGNSDRIFRRLAALIGRPELAEDGRFADNQARVANVGLLDELIGQWTAGMSVEAAEAALQANDVPASRIYTIADCAGDPHFQARNMIRRVIDPAFGEVLHPGTVPAFPDPGGNRAAGAIGRPGASLGADNVAIYNGLLGMQPAEIDALRREGVI
jgi:formyl-CoA transferase